MRTRDSIRWGYQICIVLTVILSLVVGLANGEPRQVNVGVYQNKPKVFTDENGKPAGLFIDIIEEIAKREGWTLSYVTCEWSEGLNALEKGQIDLMPDVAYSKERSEKYDFHRVPIAESWSFVYSSSKAQIEGLSDLNGRRVAVLRGAIQQTNFQQMINGLGLKVTMIPVNSFEQAFTLVANGSADAAIANNFFGDYFYRKYGLVKTTIVFDAVRLYFATSQGRNPDLLKAIDRYMNNWLLESQSPYYKILGRWTGQRPEYRVPRYLVWEICIILAMILIAVIMIFLLRIKVQTKTKKLQQANEALRISKDTLEAERQQLLAIIEFLPDPTFVIDQDKRVIAWNRAAETMTGVKKEELLGQGDYAYSVPFWGERRPILIDLLEQITPEVEAKYQYLKRVGDKVIAEDFNPRFHGGHGAYFWLVAAPLFDQAGQCCGAIEVIRDITEQRAIEQALRESEATLRSIFQAAPVGISIMKDRVFQSVNEYWLKMVAYPEESILGNNTRMLYENEEEYNRVGQELYSHLQEGRLVSVETRLRCRNGTFCEVILTGALIRNDDPSAGAVVIVYDITERKKTERALYESEQKYRELVEHANSIILRWNSEGQITFLNEFGLRFFGYAAEEIIGHHVMDTIVPSTGSNGYDLRQLMDHISADPIAFEQNVNENMRRNGERVWIAWTNRIVRDEQGKVVEIMSIGTDITERRQAEKAIRELNIHLEQRVIERTAELAVAKERAESADQLKSAFLATMSHELRTPLNSIIGFTGILLQGIAGPLNNEQLKQLGMVKNSAHHLLALINDVLDISKIEAGQLQVTLKPFDFRKSLEKTISIVHPMADHKRLDLKVFITPEVGYLMSDARRVEQILVNLLNNAVKFTDHGGVQVRCEIVDNTLVTRITDTGMGIREEDMERLFKPFSQIDTGVSRMHEGTGLGLSICKKLVEKLGGTISVQSKIGVGSTFTVTFPIVEGENNEV